MIRIGVISDTHIPKAALLVPEAVRKEFRNVDMILHAGDLVELAVITELEKLAPTHAVCGNMDMPEVKERLPIKDTIRVGGFKIGLIHGYGPPVRIIKAVSGEFSRVDVIVFGHSHSPANQMVKKTLFFNPGSPTDKIFAAHNSFGILEVDDEIKARIIRL